MRTGIAIVLMLLLAACEPSAENAIAPPTPATEAADLVIRDDIGDALAPLIVH